MTNASIIVDNSSRDCRSSRRGSRDIEGLHRNSSSVSAATALAQLHVIEMPDVDHNDYPVKAAEGFRSINETKNRATQQISPVHDKVPIAEIGCASILTPLEAVRSTIRARKTQARKRMRRPAIEKTSIAPDRAISSSPNIEKSSFSRKLSPHSRSINVLGHETRQGPDTYLRGKEITTHAKKKRLQRPSTAPVRSNLEFYAHSMDMMLVEPQVLSGLAFENKYSDNDENGNRNTEEKNVTLAGSSIVTKGFGRPRSYVDLQCWRSTLYQKKTDHRMNALDLEVIHGEHQVEQQRQRKNIRKKLARAVTDIEPADDNLDYGVHIIVARPDYIPKSPSHSSAHPDISTPTWHQSEKEVIDFGPPPPQRTIYSSNFEAWDTRCARAIDKKRQIRAAQVEHIEALLDHKMNRQARWDEKRRVERGQQLLLTFIAFSARQYIFKIGLRMGRIHNLEKRELEKKEAAVKVIQRWYVRRRMTKRISNSKRQMQALQRFIIKWQNRYRLYKRNESQAILSHWLQEAFTQGFVIRAFTKFTRRIYLIQKFTIAFIVCRRARLELLELALQKVEHERMQDEKTLKKYNEIAALEHLA